MLDTRKSTSNISALTSLYFGRFEKILGVICALLWLIGGLVSSWVFIPAVLLTVYLAAYFYSNNSAKWKRFYFRISMIYASVAGAQLFWCQERGIPFDPDMAWRHILGSIYLDEGEVECFLLLRDHWREDCDPDLFQQIVRKLSPAAPQTELDSATTRFRVLLQEKGAWQEGHCHKGMLNTKTLWIK